MLPASQSHSGDATLEESTAPHPHGGACKVYKTSLLRDEAIPGTALRVRSYDRSPMRISGFCCATDPIDAAPPTPATRLRRVELRVHHDAQLVFDVHRLAGAAAAAARCMRRVSVQIHIRRNNQRPATLDNDLLRTVENTMRVVLLGHAPFRKHHRPIPIQ